MSILSIYPDRLIVSAVLGNCAGFAGSASVVLAWTFASGWASLRDPFTHVLLAIWFASIAWLLGLVYLIAFVPILAVVRRLAPPVYVAVVALLLGAAPGLLVLLGVLFAWGGAGADPALVGGSYLYAGAGLAHGVVAAVVTCWLAYFRWGREAANTL
ncbi:MAG: hypothetical protein HYY49_03390 [Ignavibacteriales bacterium]|nr:hypothetical protein [Ignavibacteriales bacterium]